VVWIVAYVPGIIHLSAQGVQVVAVLTSFTGAGLVHSLRAVLKKETLRVVSNVTNSHAPDLREGIGGILS
jgi:hypothetical protein